MTPEEINREIAKLCDIKPTIHSWNSEEEGRYYQCSNCSRTTSWHVLRDKVGIAAQACIGTSNDYFNDLNACAEMENVLTPGQSSMYAGYLRQLLGFHQHTYFDLIHATAPQRCEAFLLTVGKLNSKDGGK